MNGLLFRPAQQPRNRVPPPAGPVRAWPTLAAFLAIASAGLGQVIITQPPQRPESNRAADKNPFAAVLHVSEEASSLLKRADEGTARQDWKLAVDSLQRIIELPGEHVLTADDRLYESARRHAQRRLAALPPPALRAYRLVHDGEAGALLDQARNQHDLTLLKTVVDRFLLSSVGPEAAVTLADWWIDDGRFAEAARLLEWLRSLQPPSDIPDEIIAARLAVALAESGQRTRALDLIRRAATSQPAKPSPRPGDPLESVRAWLTRGPGGPTEHLLTFWNLYRGDPTRNGRMDAVAPAFPPTLTWRVPLPITPPREGFDTINNYALGQGLQPVAEPVTDGHRLYVKAGSRVLAVDLETFQPLWTSQAHARDQVLSPARPSTPVGPWTPPQDQPGQQYANHPFLLQFYQDTVGSGVSLAFGRVHTVEWPGDPPPLPTLWREDGRPNLFTVQFDPGRLAANRIAAYSPHDGRLLWSTDTAGGQGELAGLQFLAAPLAVGDHLLAPARVQNDFYAVLLDPHTGRLARYVYICGTGGGPFNSLHACDPCLTDGTVYLPTGRGVLAALDTPDCSIRWLLRYDRLARKTAPSSWHTPQVVAAADVILLAPTDADQLLCIDRASADLRWSFDRGDLRCIVAASDRLVWLAGRQVVAIDLATGKTAWTRPISALTGRPALAGERLYVPTEAGLFAFDAATGEPVHTARPPLDQRLGNLLAIDFNLYSTDALAVRKFPDLDRGYERARNLHQAEPADGSIAIRLAGLELLKNRPAEALAVLDRVPPAYADKDPQRSRYLDHLRVAAMLNLVSSDTLAADKARSLLEQARRFAPAGRDAIDAAIALARFDASHDRLLDACEEYLELMLSPSGDELISQNEGLQRQARLSVDQQLADALAKLSPADGATFADRARQRLRRAAADRDDPLVQRLSECLACGPLALEASLQLAAWAIDAGRFEQAETILKRLLGQADSPPLQAQAAARLATIHLQPDDLHQPAAAAALLDRLANEYAAIPLPASIADALPGGPAIEASPTGTISAASLAAHLRGRLNLERLARHREQLEPTRLGPPRSVHPSTHADARPVLTRDQPVEPLVDKRLLLTGPTRIEVLDPTTAKLRWPVELRLLNELTVESQTLQENLARPFPLPGRYVTRARALLEGQILLINTPVGLHAVGVLTGRRLWSRPFDPPALTNQEPADSDAWFWAEDGRLVSVDAAGRLEVCPTEAGQNVLWRRTDPRRHWHWVRTRAGFVAAMDADLQQVDLFRLRDGASLGSCVFAQPPDKVSVALFTEVICGPAAENEIAAFELATPGVQRWRFAMPGAIAQIFKPTPDLLAVSDRAGRLTILDPATGTARWQTTIEICAEGVTDGSRQGDTLYVCGLQKRPRGSRPDYETQRWALAAVRFSDGQVLWQRGDLPARACLNADILRAAANAIPLAAFFPARAGFAPQVEGISPDQPTSDRAPRAGRVELIVLDKATGKPLGPPLSTELPVDAGAGLILDVRANPGVVEVVIGANYLRFACPANIP